MSTVNRLPGLFTHGGAAASAIPVRRQLERSVMACLLWEDEAYEEGEAIAERIARLALQVTAEELAEIALRAKRQMKLRHTPLLLARQLLRSPAGRACFGPVAAQLFTRPDDLTEFLALYWKDDPAAPLAKQAKRHLGEAFRRFDEYQLAKYDGGQKAVKLRDALRIVRPKPRTPEEAALWGRLARRELKTPDTWEVALSGGAGRRETFERLMDERKLGTLAFLRNLRAMRDAGVPEERVRRHAEEARVDRILPFQFVAAARAVPAWKELLEPMMFRCLEGQPKLPGKTLLVIDTSGSMGAQLGRNGTMRRLDVAAALAVLCRESCEEVSVYCTAGNDSTRVHATMRMPDRRGFALAEDISSDRVTREIGGGGIFLVQCMSFIQAREPQAERVIVLTDEQDCDTKLKPDAAPAFGARNYLVNVASARNGIGYRRWTHIDGWSEAVLHYIQSQEAAEL